MAPQDLAAALFMEHKGFPGLEPYDIDKIEDEPCWYYLYEMPEGILELEVFWNGEDWETMVTTFTSKEDVRA
jgi:hypothetical protein